MADETPLLDALRRFAHTMSGDYDLSDVLYRLTDDVTKVLDVAGAGIAISDEEDLLRYATSSSDAVAVLEQVQEEYQTGPSAEAYRLQETVTVSDIASRADWPQYRKEAQRLGFASVAGLPLSLGSERLGALNLYDRYLREWTPAELADARVLADMAAGLMVHQRLVDSRRLAAELQVALDSRVVIEQAKGILAADLGISVDRAFDLLRRHSRSNNATLRTVAQAVVTDGFRPPPA